MEEYQQFSELSREEKLELITAWVDGSVIEAYSAFGEWRAVPTGFAWWGTSIFRIAPKPVVKPSINWDHVSEKFVALAVDEDGTWVLYSGAPVADRDSFAYFGERALAVNFASFIPGSFIPSKDGVVENWRDSLVFRPGYEPKGKE
jgi:hypothetical protein